MIGLNLNFAPFTDTQRWADINALPESVRQCYRCGDFPNPATKKLDKAPLRRLATEAAGRVLYFQYGYAPWLTEIDNQIAYRDAVDYLNDRHPDVSPCYRNEPSVLSNPNADLTALRTSCDAANQGYEYAIPYTTHGYFTDSHETFEWPREIERTEARYRRVARPDATVHVYTVLDARAHIPHPLEQARQKALLAKKYGMSICTETAIYNAAGASDYQLGLLTGMQMRVIEEILGTCILYASSDPKAGFGVIGKPLKIAGLEAGLRG